jgi:hypothetical protein
MRLAEKLDWKGLRKFNLIDWVVARSKQICKLSQEQKAVS